MASFFGEVVFPSSRAFWDDDDDDDDDDEYAAIEVSRNQLDFSVRWIKDKPTRIETLVVVDGGMLADFTKKCLCPHSEEVCAIEDDKRKKVSAIYQINGDVYLCIVSPQFDVKYAGKFVESIADIITSAKNTVSITCLHVSHFKGTNIPNKPSFLRMLSTKTGRDVCKLKETLLERPNIVFGFAAGVLSYAEFMGLPSNLYVLYSDSPQLDSASAEPLLKLFSAIDCTVHDTAFTDGSFFNKGNLYM